MTSSSCSVWFAFTLIVLAQTRPAHAQAEKRRVALIDLGSALERTARSALEPWSVELVVVSEPSPGATAPRSNQAARELALKHETGAVVWISEYKRGYALWIYDLASDHTVARRLTTPPPFDGPTAAALALTIKTLLRHSATAPVRERYGAPATGELVPLDPQAFVEPARPSSPASLEASSPPSPSPPSAAPPFTTPPAATPRPTPTAPQPVLEPAAEPAPAPKPPAQATARLAASSPSEARARAAASAEADPMPASAAMVAASAAPEIELEATAGLRLLFLGAGSYTPRLGAAVTWWPRANMPGVLLRAASGPILTLKHALFEGDLLISSASLSGRMRTDLARKLRLAGALGAAGDLTRLTGATTGSPGRAVTRTKIIPSLALELTGYWLLRSWLCIGVRVAGAWLPFTQHYEVGDVLIAEVAHFTWEAGLSLALNLELPD